jgi:hypothetical protein
MPEGTMPQSLLVFFAVIFGMCCTVGLAVVIPLVANVILAVASSVFGELFASKFRGQLSGTLAPDERPGGPPKVVIGYPPGYVPPVRHGGEVKVEPDDVPIGMITRLAGAVTVVVVILVVAAIKLFDMEVASEMRSKGYSENTLVIPRTDSK